MFQLPSLCVEGRAAEEYVVWFWNLQTIRIPNPLCDKTFAHHLFHRHLVGVEGEVHLAHVRIHRYRYTCTYLIICQLWHEASVESRHVDMDVTI